MFKNILLILLGFFIGIGGFFIVGNPIKQQMVIKELRETIEERDSLLTNLELTILDNESSLNSPARSPRMRWRDRWHRPDTVLLVDTLIMLIIDTAYFDIPIFFDDDKEGVKKTQKKSGLCFSPKVSADIYLPNREKRWAVDIRWAYWNNHGIFVGYSPLAMLRLGIDYSFSNTCFNVGLGYNFNNFYPFVGIGIFFK